MPDAAGERTPDLAGSGGELEHGVVGPGIERGYERVRDRPAELGDLFLLGFPTGGRRIPVAPVLSGRGYAATPLNCGRMSLPYASSVVSCPWVIR